MPLSLCIKLFVRLTPPPGRENDPRDWCDPTKSSALSSLMGGLRAPPKPIFLPPGERGLRDRSNESMTGVRSTGFSRTYTPARLVAKNQSPRRAQLYKSALISCMPSGHLRVSIPQAAFIALYFSSR